MCTSNLPSFKQCSSVSSVSPVSGSHLDWTDSFCWSIACLGIQLQMCTSLTHRRERQRCTGKGCFCCCWRLPFSSHARSSWFWGDTNLLVKSPHSICFAEGFRTFCSGPRPGIVSQSSPLPFNVSSRCNYCNALWLGATLEDQSEATAATHCGFPLARNCSPQATCHNNSFNTLYRFAFLMFKVAFIQISRDMGKLAPLCWLAWAGKPRAWFTQRLGTFGSSVFPSLLKVDLTAFVLSFAGSLLQVSPPALTSSAGSSGAPLPAPCVPCCIPATQGWNTS